MGLPWEDIEDASDQSGIPENVIAAIALTESSGNRYAVRFEKDYKYTFEIKKCALIAQTTDTTEMMLQMTSWGYMQVMGAVARELGLPGSILTLLEPQINFKFACLLLKRLAKKYRDRSDIFAAYNAGSVIKKTDGKYQNQEYVDRVIDHLNAVNAIRGGS